MQRAGKGSGASPNDEETRARPGVLPATMSSAAESPLRSTLPALPGDLVDDEPKSIGRFVVLRRVGAGGMGVVYSGYDELLDRRLAIKLVRGGTYDATAQTRMLREAQALGRLSHPNVVQVYEVGEFSGQIYLAMEFVRGDTLRAWIAAWREAPTAVDDRPLLERLRGRVDRWAGEWREARVEACQEREDDQLAAARAICLERQLWRLEGLLDGLAAATPGIVNQGVAGVSRLEPVVRCEELRWLGDLIQEADEERGGASPQMMALERRIARLRALLSLGEFAEVAAQAESLEATLGGLEVPRLEAEARFLTGSALRKTGEYEEAAAAVAEAYFRAGAVGDDRLAAEAAIIEVAILGVDLNGVEEAETWAANATMMLDRSGLADADLGAMWHLIRGVLHRRKGDYREALASYDAAKAIIDRVLGPEHPEMAKIYANIASAQANLGAYAAAEVSLRHGLAIFIQSQGEEHPEAAVFHGNLGAILVEQGRREEGLIEHGRAYKANLTNFGADHPAIAYDLFNIGVLLNDAGTYEEAAEKLEEAQRIAEASFGPEHPMLGYILSELGRNLGARGELDPGIELLERAEKIRAEGGDPGDLATTRIYLAELLAEKPGQRARARELAELAIEVFASEEHHDAKRLPKARAWLRDHPPEELDPETSNLQGP